MDSYWGEHFYNIHNKLLPLDEAIPSTANCLAQNLLQYRFPGLWRSPGNPFSQTIMIDILRQKGFDVDIRSATDDISIIAVKGFRFTIEIRKDGFYATVGGWEAMGAYTGGRMAKVAEWINAIAEKYEEIMDYVRSQYYLEQQKTLVDRLLCAAAQTYLPAGLRCEVWHERYLNDVRVTRRLIGILAEEWTIGDTVLEDENNLQDAIEKLLQNEEVHCYMKDNGLLLSDSGQ